jgi:hypothetical protein
MIILGMDWQDTLGPMWIDWQKKTFKIIQHGRRMTIKDTPTSCAAITVEDFQDLLH